MKPKVIEGLKLQLVGFSFFGNPFNQAKGWTEENEIGRLWKRFFAYWSAHKEIFKNLGGSKEMYELHIQHPSTVENGEYEVFIGVRVERLSQMPIEVVTKILPHHQFLSYTLKGKEITDDWESNVQHYSIDYPSYDIDSSYHVLIYDNRFKGLDRIEESEMDVYVPVIPNKQV